VYLWLCLFGPVTRSAPICAADAYRTTFPSHPPYLPSSRIPLSHPERGARHAACQCVRALSRLVGVLRTAIRDSKLPNVLNIIKNDNNNKVVLIALMGIANMVRSYDSRAHNQSSYFVRRRTTLRQRVTLTLDMETRNSKPTQNGLFIMLSITATPPISVALWMFWGCDIFSRYLRSHSI